MRSLVTGAAGFIGSTLVDALLARGDDVVGVDAFTDYYGRPAKEANLETARANRRFRLVEADIAALDETGLADLLEGVEVVFHLAAQPGVRTSWGRGFRVYAERNIVATQALLEAAAGRPLRRFVFASSSSIYGDAETLPTPEDAVPRPISPYGITKLACEHLCARYRAARGVPTVVLRYFTVYGPRQRPDMAIRRMLEAGLDGRPFPVYGDGLQTRDVTYVDDAVAATIAAASAPGAEGGVFNVGSGSRVTLREIVEAAGRAIGAPIRTESMPAVPGDARATGAAIDRARAVLGFRPAVALEEGLRRQAEWQRNAR